MNSSTGKINGLKAHLPKKPYCCNDLLTGLRIRPLEIALCFKYLQLNPPCMRWALVFDIDYDAGADITDEYFMPPPRWAVVNRQNGHLHIIYTLAQPVCSSDAAHLAPLKYLAAIERAYCERLKADPLYTGLIAKNPWSDFWQVFDMNNDKSYELNELARCVCDELAVMKKVKRPASEIAGLGRNCHVFETVRLWSYRAVREYWGHGASEWEDAVHSQCVQTNSLFPAPLYGAELRGISRSIARWTWRRFRPEDFSRWQKHSSERRWNTESRRAEGIEMLRGGFSTDEVAELLQVSIRTAQIWQRTIKQREVTEKIKPWENLKISRAWYYKLEKEGKLEQYQRIRNKKG